MAAVEAREPMEGSPSASLVRAHLARVLASDLFVRSERLSAFLTFIVEQTLDGHGDTLKEQVIATALYGKPPGFSTAEDPIVRVDARRLRDRLREYYASAADDDLLTIAVPKGSYTPVFAHSSRKGRDSSFQVDHPPPITHPSSALHRPSHGDPRGDAASSSPRRLASRS